jgi:carboxyl-terminal processing protease
MKDNSNQNGTFTAVMKLVVAGVVVLILVLAAFGAGVGIGVGQGRSMAAAAAPAALGPAEQVETQPGAAVPEAAPVEPAGQPVLTPTPAEQAAAPAAGQSASPTAARATSTPVAGGTPGVTPSPTVPQPTPTRQDKSALPDQAPLDTALINEAWKLLKEQYYGNLPTGEDVTYAAIRGIVATLGDKHTVFLDPKQAEVSNESISGQFEGIGALVDTADGGGVKLQHLFADQPAQKAGLQDGDVVVRVDGKDISQLALDDAVALIRGPRGTKVTLTVKRGDQAPFDVTVTRARIEIPVVESKTLGDGKVEYIKLSEFSAPAADRVQAALKSAADKKPQGIILDLRDDPGGLLDSAVRIGSFFIPQGNIVIERFADGRQQEYARQGPYLLNNIPLVVLVNGGSASASEIVAGAIQDTGAGKLLGTQTYGKGSVQLPNEMSDKSQLRVTIAKWYTPKNRGIDGTGLAPDIESPDPTADQLKAKQDPQLDRAVEYLLTGK